jgi:hydroxypyruvate isomerase
MSTSRPSISVCLETVWTDRPVVDRIDRVGELGLDAVEFWSWRDKDLEAVRDRCARAGLDVLGMVGTDVPLTDPSAHDRAVEAVRESVEAAVDLGCRNLILTSGPAQASLPRDDQRDAVVSVLERVAEPAADAGVGLLLEPLNTAVDHPDSFLATTRTGLDIVESVGHPSVNLLYDVYHQQITEGDIIRTLRGALDRIGHVHVADVPGRHEPGTGELNYENVLAALVEAGYEGMVGCEFYPQAPPADALRTVADLGTTTPSHDRDAGR